MTQDNPSRTIRGEVVVEASVDPVWTAWTTPTGISSFFAPACNVELRLDGPYEIYFNPEAEPGLRGGEGNRILAFQPNKMLSFTWNAPPSLPDVRQQRTHVVVRFETMTDGRTQVRLAHDGWGEGQAWDEAFAYFSRAWTQVVLPRLQYRFSVGIVDWHNPPQVTSS